MNIADKAIKDIKKPFCMDSLLVAVILLVTLSLVTTVANTNILSYFNYPVPISRILIVISLLSNFFITFPLLAIIIMDEQIQQQIYLHAAAYFGKHDIAFIGDSIIKGGHVWATKIGVYNLNVWNYGHGGLTTKQVSFYAQRVAKENFKFCFVMCGGNDEFNDSNSVLQSYRDYIANLQILKIAHVEAIVTLLLYNKIENNRKHIDEFNNKIRIYCIGNQINFIDLNSFLCDGRGLKKEYTRDGNHLNFKAYLIWGREINRILHEKKYL